MLFSKLGRSHNAGYGMILLVSAFFSHSGHAEPALEEVIVSATKRDVSLRDIPASIAALSGADVEDRGAMQLSDFLEQVPGVSLNPLNVDQNRLSIRGVGADTANLLTSQTAAILIGDTAFSDPFITGVAPDLNPFDLATVEILKGPQGTLFGGSALSGAVRYVPNRPDFEGMSAKAFYQIADTAEGGDSDAAGLAVNLPVSDSFAMRAAGVERDNGGIIDDTRRNLKDVDATHQRSYRGMLRWQPNNRWTVDFLYLRQSSEQDDLASADNTRGDLTRNTTAGESQNDTDFDVATLELRYDFSPGTLVSVTSRINKSLDQNIDGTRAVSPDFDDSVRVLAVQDVNGVSQELRWVSADDGERRLHWVAGVFKLDYEQQFLNAVIGTFNNALASPLPVGPVVAALPAGSSELVTSNADIELTEKAVFGDVGWRITDRLEFSAGLRWFDTETSGRIVSRGALISATTGQSEVVNDAAIQADGYNPKLSLRFELNDNFSIYAAASKGFRFGGIQALSDTPTTEIEEVYGSDKLWNYEIGFRSQWLERRVILDGTVYQIDWDNPQISQKTSDGLFNVVDNVGGAEIDGAELSLQWLTPLTGLRLVSTAAYTDSRSSEPFKAPNGDDVAVGSYMPGTPLWQTFVSLRYERAVGPFNAGGHISHAYVSEAQNDLNGNVTTLGYDTLEAGLNIFAPQWPGRPRLSAIMTNIEDERGIANVLYTNANVQDVYYIRPRTLSIRLSLDF